MRELQLPGGPLAEPLSGRRVRQGGRGAEESCRGAGAGGSARAGGGNAVGVHAAVCAHRQALARLCGERVHGLCSRAHAAQAWTCGRGVGPHSVGWAARGWRLPACCYLAGFSWPQSSHGALLSSLLKEKCSTGTSCLAAVTCCRRKHKYSSLGRIWPSGKSYGGSDMLSE